ncbi:hypothetical protein, partial [Pseudomonas chlororaphis]|uniref:hypothetical protein n=1 Tax=Pseudomonas chlororaphis TaxID=587753 RepID=UPI001EE681AA
MARAGNKRKQANDFFMAGYLWGQGGRHRGQASLLQKRVRTLARDVFIAGQKKVLHGIPGKTLLI